MEQVKDLLTASLEGSAHGYKPLSQKEQAQIEADMYNKEVGKLNEIDGYDCKLCNNRGFITELAKNERFGYYYTKRIYCKCQKVRSAIRRLKASGLQNFVKDYTFEKYEAAEKWQQHIKTTAQNFLKDDSNNWFYIGGQSGAGKSHICSAIAVQYIRDGKDVKYMLWRDEINKIKAVVNDAQQYEDLIKPLKEIAVLYIDDLFKGGKDESGHQKPPSEAEVRAAFEIINYRYNNPELVTIISSERTLVDLNRIDEAIAGRIAEKTKINGYCINLKPDASRNWRMKGLVEI
jgi:DNA replication protein DnaC